METPLGARLFDEVRLSDTQDPLTQMRTLGFLWMANNFHGHFETASRFSERLAALGRTLNVPVFESNGRACSGLSLMMLGRPSDAEKSLEQASRHSTTALVASLHTRWLLGYPDQALAKAHAARAQAQAVGEPHSLCLAAAIGSTAWRLRREPEQLAEATQVAIALCEKYGYSYGHAMATWMMGVALSKLGRVEQGLALIREGIAALHATGSRMNLPESNGCLAEQCMANGRLSEAHAALDEAFRFVEQQNNRWWEAELHRVKGELLLAENAGNTASAEASFQRALEVARSQQAKSLELRAATSLARLWQKHARSHEAREVLKAVYDWFTEGFDTPDLVDAKALLEALA